MNKQESSSKLLFKSYLNSLLVIVAIWMMVSLSVLFIANLTESIFFIQIKENLIVLLIFVTMTGSLIWSIVVLGYLLFSIFARK